MLTMYDNVGLTSKQEPENELGNSEPRRTMKHSPEFLCKLTHGYIVRSYNIVGAGGIVS